MASDSSGSEIEYGDELIEVCQECGGHLSANEPAHYKSPDERFWHAECYENDGPPEEYIVDVSEDWPHMASVNRQYNCGHLAYGPPRHLPEKCPECGVRAP